MSSTKGAVPMLRNRIKNNENLKLTEKEALAQITTLCHKLTDRGISFVQDDICPTFHDIRDNQSKSGTMLAVQEEADGSAPVKIVDG